MTGPDRRPARLHVATLHTPAGPFTLLFGDSGVAAAGFTADPADLRRLLGPQRNAILHTVADAGAVGAAIAAYFAGDLAAIDQVPVTAAGTAYQERAWAALRSLQPGEPVTYAELAARTGSPAAPRAVGSACGRNPTALVVPCHRVVRADGTLGGFLWGIDVKRWLLDHERRHAGLQGCAPNFPPHPRESGRGLHSSGA